MRLSRFTIRQQALVRFSIVMVTLILCILAIGLSSYFKRLEREVAQKTEVTRNFYAELLPRLETTWQNQAEQTRSRIEFTRILEEKNDLRWASLNTFLTAQWEFLEFSNLLVFSPRGELLYRYGSESGRLPANLQMLNPGWYYINETQELYRTYQLPVWLGSEGQGTLLLFKQINSGVLQTLEIPDTHLHLYAFGTLLANSNPFKLADGKPGEEGLHREMDPPMIQIDLLWPHESSQAPLLIIHHEFHDSLPMREFMVRPLVAILMVSMMLWLGLGHWLSRSVRRIESLDAATRRYTDGEGIEAAAQALHPARAVHDEIADVATTLEQMMLQVHQRDLEQKSYLDTLALLEEAVLELDCEGRLVHASPGWHRLVHSAGELKGMAFTEFIHRDDAEVLRGVYASFAKGEKAQAQLRLRLRNDNGAEQWVECRLVVQMASDGRLCGSRGVVRDITQTYLHEQQITHMALHDALTDLPNRILLEDRIKIATRMASRSGHKVAVCFIDLDHFKNINDSLGHKAGDRLLLAFATTLRSLLRAGDTLARWGGDEFVLLLPELASEEDAREVAQKIWMTFRQSLAIDDGTDYVVTFSMGVSMYPDDALEVESLLSHADRAMFYAKTQGRNQTSFFGEIADKGGGKRELYIQNRLVEAVAARRIQAWFQPIVAADGTCDLVEVLARWHDEEFGWVSPATFIPIAENTGTIRDLGYQVWEQCLDALVAWRARGINLRAAINVSKRQLFSDRFADQLARDLQRRALSPDAFVIEVTESVALLDVAHASERLDELHAKGFHLAIDDFGTGYSALSQLHEMPVDELKIDISFVRRIHEPSGYSMVQAIIQLAKALGLQTIAEGVEDEATAQLLKSLGVGYLQGYHFAKPMPRPELDTWLSAR